MRDVVPPDLSWEHHFKCEKCDTTGIAEATDLHTNKAVSDQRDDYYLAAGSRFWFKCPTCNQAINVPKDDISTAVRNDTIRHRQSGY